MVKVVKHKGDFVDVLENLFMQISQHESHFLYYSLRDLDWSEIRCGRCKTVVVDGSRELIEMIWVGCNPMAPDSDCD